ncbi:MAG: TetR/AcrR family transcriptional regulator [Chloroflexota bacterium]
MTRKAEIIQAAQQILVEEGHYRLSMRHVAERVGIKLASLQYHFPSKKALIGVLLAESLGHYHQLVLELVTAVSTNEDPTALNHLFTTYQDSQVSGIFEQLWALSIQEPELKRQYDEAYASLWQGVAALVRRFDAQANDAQCKTRAALIIALLDGLETFFGTEQLRQEMPELLQTAVLTQIKAIASGHPT